MTDVIGIDPGSAKIGLSRLTSSDNKIQLLESLQVYLIGKTTEERLNHLYQFTDNYLIQHPVKEIALEETFVAPFDNKKGGYKFNLDAPLKLSMARGCIWSLAGKHYARIFEYSNGDVKKTATGNHQATKNMIIKKMSSIFSRKFEEDEADSVAIGITHLLTMRTKHKENPTLL
jgi:crossover junction endodeoxyribonuclease RuvC